MSVPPLKADIRQREGHVRYVPKSALGLVIKNKMKRETLMLSLSPK